MARLAVAARAFSASTGAGAVSMVQAVSRGIGLEFVQQLLRRSDQGLTVLPLDVTDEATIEAAAASIAETHGSLDLLINSTGILSIPNVIQPETTLSKVQKSSLLLAYKVNAVGPILMIKVKFTGSLLFFLPVFCRQDSPSPLHRREHEAERTGSHLM